MDINSAIPADSQNGNNKPASMDEQVSLNMLSQVFKENFAKLDSNSDSFVDENEAIAARDSGNFKGKDAILVDILCKHGSILQTLSNDERGPENDGVTQADMDALLGIVSKVNAANGSTVENDMVHSIEKTLPFNSQLRNPKIFGNLLKHNFNEFDKDQSGKISKPEIEETIASDKSSPEIKKLGKAILANYDELANVIPNEGNYVSLNDAKEFNYYTDPKEHIVNRTNIRSTGLKKAPGQAFTSALLGGTAALAGIAAIASPEPATKVTFGLGTVALIGGSSYFATHAIVGICGSESKAIQSAYERRQKMLTDWSYFKQ